MTEQVGEQPTLFELLGEHARICAEIDDLTSLRTERERMAFIGRIRAQIVAEHGELYPHILREMFQRLREFPSPGLQVLQLKERLVEISTCIVGSLPSISQGEFDPAFLYRGTLLRRVSLQPNVFTAPNIFCITDLLREVGIDFAQFARPERPEASLTYAVSGFPSDSAQRTDGVIVAVPITPELRRDAYWQDSRSINVPSSVIEKGLAALLFRPGVRSADEDTA